MRLIVAAYVCALGVATGGCNFTAATKARLILTDQQALAKQATETYADYIVEDRTLRFLSATGYSCGDPKRQPKNPKPEVAKAGDAAGVKNAKQTVAKQNEQYSETVRKALDVLQAYKDELDAVAKDNTKSSAGIKKAFEFFAKTVGAAGYGSAKGVIEAAGPLALAVNNARSAVAQQQIAIEHRQYVILAVGDLLKHADELYAQQDEQFKFWNDCARETLVYLRDVPLNRVRGYNSYVGQSSGIELRDAYASYLEKRAEKLSKRPSIQDDLKALLDENEKLASGVPIDYDGLGGLVDNIGKFVTAIQTATAPPKDDKAKSDKDSSAKDKGSG